MKTWTVLGMLILGLFFSREASAIGSCIKESNPQTGTIVVLHCGPPETLAVHTGCDTNDTPPVDEDCDCPWGDDEAYIPPHCGNPIIVIPVFEY